MTARVTVTINGRSYQIACDDGQESHLLRLADYVDKRVSQLVAAVGQVGDAHLLVMASLLVADELTDARTEAESLRHGRPAAAGTAEGIDEDELAERLQSLSERMESLAERLEGA